MATRPLESCAVSAVTQPGTVAAVHVTSSSTRSAAPAHTMVSMLPSMISDPTAPAGATSLVGSTWWNLIWCCKDCYRTECRDLRSHLEVATARHLGRLASFNRPGKLARWLRDRSEGQLHHCLAVLIKWQSEETAIDLQAIMESESFWKPQITVVYCDRQARRDWKCSECLAVMQLDVHCTGRFCAACRAAVSPMQTELEAAHAWAAKSGWYSPHRYVISELVEADALAERLAGELARGP